MQLICNCIWRRSAPILPSLSGTGWVLGVHPGQCQPIDIPGNHAMSATKVPPLPSTFNRLAWSNLAAQSAEQIALAAAPIVAVLLLGVGEGQTGLLQTALTLPFILFAIPAGLLADRISRRYLMAGAEVLRAAALAATLLLIWLGLMTLPLLAL